MDDIQKKALLKSIQVWKEKLAEDDFKGIMFGTNNCPLCVVNYDNKCINCPVLLKTGELYCNGSPYEKALHAWQKLYSYLKQPRVIDGEFVKLVNAWRENCKKEIEFLESLLPEGEN